VAEGGGTVRPRSEASGARPGQHFHPPGLPPDAHGELSRRLTLTALVIAAMFAASVVVTSLVSAVGWQALPHPRLHAAIGGAAVAISLAVSWVAWEDRLPSARLLALGLGYETVVGLAIALQDNVYPVAALGRPLHDISLLAVLIVMFPMVIPAPLGRRLTASLATATMWPLAFLAGVWLGNPVPPLPVVGLNVLENYIAAALAMVPAMIIQSLTTDVQKARQMGSYRLVELLGRGGMGEVWRAEHNMLARPAAIKLVRGDTVGLGPGSPDEALLRRFEREAQATAALHSPHTVELYDFGVTADGTFYYVMEVLDGLDLEQLVRRFGPQPPARTVYLLAQLCDSLADAHAVGLVHRDVKPANVYACRRGLKYDFVKLLDFGLVKPAWRQDLGESSLTHEDAVPGTPAYIAPEVALGSLEVDGRADLYAVGCVAYWLLTGHRVFEAATALQVALQHAQAVPVPPSHRVSQAIPPTLEAAVMACLEKDPARRPASANELARRLEDLGLARTWSQDEARAWWSANLPAG
jgi:serine/threonine-protein kinase